MLMEAGASAHSLEEIAIQVVIGLGADRIDLRVGCTSLAITVAIGPDWITRTRKIGLYWVEPEALELESLTGRGSSAMNALRCYQFAAVL